MESIKKKIERYLNHEACGSDVHDIRQWFERDESLGDWLRDGIEQSDARLPAEADKRIRATLAKAVGETASPAGEAPAAHANRWSVLRHAVDIAAAIVLVAGIGIFIIFQKDTPYQSPLVVSTGVGQRSAVTLPDGTRVTMNSMSEIAYRFDETKGVRGVDIKGEAYFDVARDPAHPFIVTCDNIAVECRGTEFDVKGYADDDNISVVLNDGEVMVSDALTSISMKPDMMVRYQKNERRFTSQRVYAEDYNDWMEGSMRFNDERLEDIVKVLARNYKVHLSIVSPELRHEPFTGTLGGGGLNDRLRVLTTAADASFRMENDTTGYIYKETKNK